MEDFEEMIRGGANPGGRDDASQLRRALDAAGLFASTAAIRLSGAGVGWACVAGEDDIA